MARENALVFGDLVNRMFEEEMFYGDILNVPPVSALVAQTKNLNSALNYEALTETNVQITVNVWEYSAIAIETRAKKQSFQDLIKRYAPKMGYALALAVDDVLAGLPDNVDNIVGALANALTYEDCLRAIQYLDDANAPLEDRQWVIAPAQRAGFFALEQFVNTDYAKLNSEVRGKGATRSFIGNWMDTPVFMTANVEGTNAAGHDNTVFHKEAFALVVQLAMKSYNHFDIDYFADKYATEQLYGTQEMRDDHAVFCRGL